MLGHLALLGPSGLVLNPISKRRRKLALLAYIALARRPVGRDQLVEMFWGEQDEKRARHSLSDALSELRGHLGADAIETRTSDLQIGVRAPLKLDAREFVAACDAHDWPCAVSLYRGPFLNGVTVEHSSSFEDWKMREGDLLAQRFARACREQLAALKARQSWGEAASLAERWLVAAPLSADAAVALLEALSAPGGSTAAQEAHAAYERLVARLSRDYDMEPDPKVATFAARLAETAATAAAIPPAEDSAPASAKAAAPPSPPASHRPIGRRFLIPILAALGVIIAAALAVMVTRPRPGAGAAKPVVAVVMIRSLGRDTAAAWLEDGLRQMIAADLSRSTAVDIVAPERVRAVLVRSGLLGRPELSAEELRSIGHRLGATWVVTGAFTRGKNIYVLDVSLRAVATASLTRLYTVAGADPLTVADAAAARVLDAADAAGPGPRFAALETSSLEAYQHYVRSLQAVAQGQYAEGRRELDAAIALDSDFVSALVQRIRLAVNENEPVILERLRRRYRGASLRATPWDVLELEVRTALHGGDHARAEALGRDLVARFPRDPTSFAVLADVYQDHGRWEAADTVLRQELALDSLATESGRGPCAPCGAYAGLISVRLAVGRLADAEQAARRWVQLQPDIPASWTNLATVLAFEGRNDVALGAARRAADLAPDDAEYTVRVGRILLMGRRFEAVDSAIHQWRHDRTPGLEEASLDLQALLERERGQFRESIATIDRVVRRYPLSGTLRLEQANSMGRIGRDGDARRVYETMMMEHAPRRGVGDVMLQAGLTGDDARAFSWVHAQEADAIGDRADTMVLRALADSIGRISQLSYYRRDWGLAHHVLGLIAERGGRHAEAAREFQQARFGVAGWTRTNARMAEALMAAGRPVDAIAVLHDGYAAPLDAMGRYQPRSELDFLMALAFQRANLPDSAARYEAFVREAWKDAEPESRSRLAELSGH